jgi:predicted NBD/HSP70 family sugar kinase
VSTSTAAFVPSTTAPARRPARSTGSPAGSVLAAARRAGPSFRDELAGATGLSHATVNRQVAALLAAGLLRERPDLVPVGAVGRPRIPVEVDPDRFGVLGMHIGVRGATLAVADPRGRVLEAVEVPNPRADPAETLALLTTRLRRLGERRPGRRTLWTSVVVGGQLSADRGRLRHPRLGWDGVPVAEIVNRVAGSDVVVVPQVEAMATADLLRGGRPLGGSTLYVYAREAVGVAVISDGTLPAPGVGPGTISHLPVGGPATCHCGSTGCLEASVADGAVADAAYRAGIVPSPAVELVVRAAQDGDRAAHELLVERARLLGRGVALARDVFNPDRVVLLGQAFTGYRPALADLSASFTATSVLEPLTPTVSSLGSGVQALAAATAALQPVYRDPLGAARKATARHRAATNRAGIYRAGVTGRAFRPAPPGCSDGR